jgi:hypothetical protein
MAADGCYGNCHASYLLLHVFDFNSSNCYVSLKHRQVKTVFSHKIRVGKGNDITLAASAQILFSEMLKISKLTLCKEQLFVTENEESFGMFWNILFSKWNLQN